MNLCDQIITAFEGGSNYWISHVNMHGQKYGEPETFERPDWRIDISTHEDDQPFTLNEKAVIEGMAILKDKYPDRYKAVMSDDWDADDSDVFLQVCLFKEIVYG